MKLQTFALLVVVVFTACAFAADQAAAVCCGNECTATCKPGSICNCPAWCDPKYSECDVKRSSVKRSSVKRSSVKRDAAPYVFPLPPGVPCGCHNACTLYGCGGSIKGEPGVCGCLDYCDPAYACDVKVKAREEFAPAPVKPPRCGCYNDCTYSGCVGKPDCICTQECDPKYECPLAVKCGCTNDCKIACPSCTCLQYCDPKYECPPTVRCGCTNDCKIGCPSGGCLCPQYCDPKYECRATQ